MPQYKQLTKELLIEEYLVNKKSSIRISKENGCTNKTVLNYLRRNGIQVRTHSESAKLKKLTEEHKKKIANSIKPASYYEKMKTCHSGIRNGSWKHGLCGTKQYSKVQNNRRRIACKDLTIKIIQFIYEENIKRYGTLTCYLCENPIEFGNDHLEHKIPISRGGTNTKDNLDVACKQCNLKKGSKTLVEFRGNTTSA